MRAKGLSAVLLALVLLTSALAVPGALAAEGAEKIAYNRFNIVLVTDTSGSMKSTDKNGLRFEAIGKFVAMLAERGNRVGSVVFHGGIAFQQALADTNGIVDKRQIIANIQGIPAGGSTNIGLGLMTAVDMLNADKNPDIPSIILLLSDGNTDLDTKEELERSLEQKADAIQAAREAGYKIFTISLNADGTANSDELTQIAQATGGEFQEVRNAGDLEDVFNMYYTLIFSSRLNRGEEITFPPSGEVSGTFDISSVGVEEVNVVLSGKTTDYSLADPAGKAYSKEALSQNTYTSDTYSIIKIVAPLAGTWSYTVKGIPQDKIQINIVYNSNLSSDIAVARQDYYAAGEAVTVWAQLIEAGAAVEPAQYEGFAARLHVTDGQGVSKAYDMALGSRGFEYSFTPPQSGYYTLRANITSAEYDLTTQNLMLDVMAQAPKPDEPVVVNAHPQADEPMAVTVLLWPFLDNTKVIDLTPGATDAEDDTLRYEVISTAFMDSEFTLSGSTLTLTGYSLPKGAFTVRAFDSEGAFCDFEVVISTVNITLVGALLIAGGALIALAVLGVGLWIALNKRFMGSCYVTLFDDSGNYYEEVKREKGRGRLLLSAFNLQGSGFNTSKCYFQASGKDYVTFCTPEKVYGDGRTDKQFRVDGNGYEVTIAADESAQRGIRVKFISRLNNSSNYF